MLLHLPQGELMDSMAAQLNLNSGNLMEAVERKKLIYVVEDDEEQLGLLRLILTDAGFDVVTESDADKVVNGVRELRPDIILMDVMLPSRHGLDGFLLCSELKKDPELSTTKIIIVSAIAQGIGAQREKMRAQVGADDF